jgi:hypothetical protein
MATHSIYYLNEALSWNWQGSCKYFSFQSSNPKNCITLGQMSPGIMGQMLSK